LSYVEGNVCCGFHSTSINTSDGTASTGTAQKWFMPNWVQYQWKVLFKELIRLFYLSTDTLKVKPRPNPNAVHLVKY